LETFELMMLVRRANTYARADRAAVDQPLEAMIDRR